MTKCDTCKEAEELCKATYVMEDMVDRLYDAESNLETNMKKFMKERELVSEFEEKSIEYFKKNGNLPEWFIRYKLGQRLTCGYNLFSKEDEEEEYKENKNYSVGYKGWWIYGKSPKWTHEGKWIDDDDVGLREWLRAKYAAEDESDESDDCEESDDDSNNMGYETKLKADEPYHKLEHLRFNYDAEFSDSNQEIMDIFRNYYFDRKVLIYSHEGCIYVKIIDGWDKNVFNDWEDYEEVGCGYTTTEGINIILSMIHKEVFPKIP